MMFASKRILITGGLGFIGSNLAIRLVKEGAYVTIVDSMISDYGGNLFNIHPIKKKVHINFSDITDKNAMEYVIRDKDSIFHLAGQVSHVLSLTNPFPDIDYNITGTAVLLEACRKYNPQAIIVFTGTRGQYGSSIKLPVDETAHTNPKGIYELTNLTAEKMFKVYYENHGIRSVLTRLTNIYGPRAQMKSNKYGVVNWFIRQAISNEQISLFGDGLIKRDVVYVDDCVDALLSLAQREACYGEIFNVGDDKPWTFKQIVSKIIELNGYGSFKFTPFSEERKKQEPGDFYSDISKISAAIGWKPTTSFTKGLRKTIEFYKKYKEFYW
ncbi:NAD-dependent epimerase/dehydratase family protein [Candidatus Roizmanbacteria bacterium]|nr:NAD-dependent epimerase/dehydratase family protein [Candidatus Roizmanbacteria bacterium]